jgi:hypothetical protein
MYGPLIPMQQSRTSSPFVVLHHSTGSFWTSFTRMAESFAVIAPDMPDSDARNIQLALDRHVTSPFHACSSDQLETGLIWPDSGWGLGGAEMATMGAGRFEQVDRCVAAKHRYPYIMLDNKLVS